MSKLALNNWKHLLIVIGMLVLTAGPAQAVGPFEHLEFVRGLWPEAASKLGLADKAEALLPAAYAGALALNAGHYLPGGAPLADAVHIIKPVELAEAMLRLAVTDEDKAFAVGWLASVNLDRLTYPSILNALAAGPRTAKPLRHLRMQWGLECQRLEAPGSAWMWSLALKVDVGLELWQKAMAEVYGAKVPLEFLAKAQKAQAVEVRRMPEFFWLTGQLWRPGGIWGNLLGQSVNSSLRPAALAWLRWSGAAPRLATMLDADRSLALGQEMTGQLKSLAAAQVLAVLGGAKLPRGNLYAVPACNNGGCPAAQRAAQWLAEQR